MTDQERKERKVQWERRAQSVMLAVVTSAILWMCEATISSRTDLAEIKPRINSIEITLSGAYRASDAHRDVLELTTRIGGNEHRLDGIDQRIDRVEAARRVEFIKVRP